MMAFPAPDRSNKVPHFTKADGEDYIDLGWGEGALSDGRPYRAECWAAEGQTWLTIFFSTQGIEQLQWLDAFRLLVKEALVTFEAEQPVLEVFESTDASGNKVWEAHILVGDSDGLLARDSVKLREYERPAKRTRSRNAPKGSHDPH